MKFSFFSPRERSGSRWRWALPSLVVLAVGAAVWWWQDNHASWTHQSNTHTTTPNWKLVFGPDDTTPPSQIDDPEAQLRLVYKSLGEGQRELALQQAEQLALQFPTFQLGQLVYADLLNISATQPQNETLLIPEQPGMHDRLKDLVLEAQRRLTHPSFTQVQGKKPAQLLMLGKEHPYLVVVDASASRLYWFANKEKADGHTQLELLSSTYASVGQNGVGKNKEGDGKTPLGVYFTQRNLPGRTLPDLFGAGAITLNYPNAIDLWRGRTGTGIWLHGTPQAQYTRAPLATDGCVVVANPKMGRFLELPDSRMTPVIITEHMQWVDAQAPKTALQNELQSALHQWLQARTTSGSDEAALRSFYSNRFERDGLDIGRWWETLLRVSQRTSQADALQVTSAVLWKDQEDLAVVTFRHSKHPGWGNSEYWRTYWVHENGAWKIVFEGPA
ncbi:MAG: hypothetical protein RLZ63_1910 [Pseudomonadota bacterium]